jgi:holo-[acyl-carrier protein] synthase
MRRVRDSIAGSTENFTRRREGAERRPVFLRVSARRFIGAVAGDSRRDFMILGLGSDLIDIRRIEKTIERHGDRFLDRIFTPVERAKSDKRAQRAASYAKRFAAKEACAKALGTGLRRGVFWRDMGVVNVSGGKPTMQLSGGALRRLHEITPDGHEAVIDVSITDDFPLAQAIVIVSAVARPPHKRSE